MSGTLLLTSAACFLSFGWALRRHFRSEGGVPLGMQLLSLFSLLAYGSFAALLLPNHPTAVPVIAALSFFLSSLVMFWWTVGSTRADRLSLAHSAAGPVCFVDRGPYALVRHPFYLSYLMFWTGTAVAVGHAQWLCAAILATWYVAIARREEKRFAASAFGLTYRSYRQRTGMLLPRAGLWRDLAHAAWDDGVTPKIPQP